MAFTVSQLEGIERAIASGSLVVHYDNKRTEYRSMPELFAARNLIREDLIGRGLLSPGTVGESARGGHTLARHTRD